MRRLVAQLVLLGWLAHPAPWATAQVYSPQAPAQPVTPATRAEAELQQLMQQLTVVGETLVRNVQSPQAWQYQLQQADLLLQIASRSSGADRGRFLRMAIESYHSTAVQSPTNERIAMDRLTQLPQVIQQYFPRSDLGPFAALQTVRAEHARRLNGTNTKPEAAQADLAQRLLGFAQSYPGTPEAIASLQEAAQIYTSQSKTAEARRCFQVLAESQAGKPIGREARAALRRLGGLNGEVIDLKLPLLYPTAASGNQTFDIQELRGKRVVVYFWSSDSPGVDAGFDALKHVTDQFQFRGVAVVCVCLDHDPEVARRFLAGKLLAGTHVLLKEGRKSRVAERCGLENLPEIFLLDQNGRLLNSSLSPAHLETTVAGYFPSSARDR